MLGGARRGGPGGHEVAEVLPFFAWSPTTHLVERRPASKAELIHMFRQIDTCRERRQRLVLGGQNAVFVIAAYLTHQLSPVVSVREVIRLLETKLPHTFQSHEADSIAAYVVDKLEI